MAYFTGKSGEVDAGGNTLPVTNWAADTAADLEATTHSGSGGYKTFILNTKGCTGTIDMNWDAAANPTALVPAIKAGTDIGTLKLYLESGQGFLTAASAYINSVAYSTPVEGVVAISISFTVSGAFTEPVGAW